MSKVGFIGLGIMGKPMASHLAKAGIDLTVCDLDGDGYVDAYDASLIQRFSIGIITAFPIETKNN